MTLIRGHFVKQFVEENSDAPNVHLVCLVFGEQDFWGKIVVSAAFGRSLDFATSQVESEFCRESEINQLEFLAIGDEDILGLDISVDDAFRVNVRYCFEDLPDEEEGFLLGEVFIFSNVGKELFSLDEFEDEVEVAFVEKLVVELDYVFV